MRKYINEPTKCLKIKDFRFWLSGNKAPRDIVERCPERFAKDLEWHRLDCRKCKNKATHVLVTRIGNGKNKAILPADLLQFLEDVVFHHRTRNASGRHQVGGINAANLPLPTCGFASSSAREREYKNKPTSNGQGHIGKLPNEATNPAGLGSLQNRYAENSEMSCDC